MAAGNAALNFQEQQWAKTQANEAPFIAGGQAAYGQLSSMLTPKGAPAPGAAPMASPAPTGMPPVAPAGSGLPMGGVQQQAPRPMSSMASPQAPVQPLNGPGAGTGAAVRMQAPDGSVAMVPAAQVQTMTAKGAKVL